jgi:hypothetical protein
MPLPQYGVAIGTYVSFQRDPQHQYGQWYHGHLTINTPQGSYQSALDVDTPSGVGVSYRTSVGLAQSVLGPVAALANGWHPLASTSTSGAVDYLRSPYLQDLIFRRPFPYLRSPLVEYPAGPHLPPNPPPGPLDAPPPEARTVRAIPDWATTAYDRFLKLSGRVVIDLPFLTLFRPWVPSTGDNALSVLEGQFPGSTRIYLFGEHYEDGTNGVHDVHMNQGDPPGSQWYASDGIWQDGAVFVERPNGTLFCWQVMFNSQSTHTDDHGHPI